MSADALTLPFSRLYFAVPGPAPVTACPALCPVAVTLNRVPFGPLPSLHQLRRGRRTARFVRRLPRYYGAVRLPQPVHRRLVPTGFTTRTASHHLVGQTEDLPILAQGKIEACSGSSTAPGPTAPRLAAQPVLPSARPTASAPRMIPFRGSLPGPSLPLSTLRCPLSGGQRMTRGRCGLLLLHRTDLSSASPCRF